MVPYWDDLKYLLALEQGGSLVSAAKILNTNPTTVSRHVKRLSETYQRTLVSRTSNGEWSMTEHGKAFAKTARLCQNEIARLGGPDEEMEQQTIRVSTVDFVAEYFLTPKLSYLPVNPEKTALSLEAADKNVSLAYGEADLAIRLGRPKQGRLIISKIGTIDMGLFASERVGGTAWIGLTSDLDWVPEMQAGYEIFGEPPAIRLSSFNCIRRVAVERGLPCVGPDSVMRNWNGLERVNTGKPQPFREVWSVIHEDRRQDELLLKTREWARTCFTSEADVAAA